MEKTRGFIGEFKEFISRGNVVDMAVGVIIGGAFTTIVTSLVNDVIMPVIGIILGKIDFTNLKYVITPATADTPESAICYGMFIQNLINFILIALVVFLVIKGINKFRRKEEEVAEEPAPEEPAEDVLLLREIRDLLDKK